MWDEADYVVPPAENGAFFITTNVLITPNQTQVTRPTLRCTDRTVQGLCAEHPGVRGAACNTSHNRCRAGQYLKKGHGIMTGG